MVIPSTAILNTFIYLKIVKLNNRTKKDHESDRHICVNCGNSFTGKICNQCGEKVFYHEQLSFKSFLHHWVDLFTHFDNKVLKSIWLTIVKPGFITKENLLGKRVRYAKPVQLFIIVNLLFYLTISYLNRSDYIPSAFDNYNSAIHIRPGLGWTKPFDDYLGRSIDSLREKKLAAFNKIETRSFAGVKNYYIADTVAFNQNTGLKPLVFLNTYDQKVSFFSKTLVFLLIPIFACFFYIFFYKRLKYFGAALILATHFAAFVLLFYSLLQLLSFLPSKWFGVPAHLEGLPFKPVQLLFYNDVMDSFSTAVFGMYRGFEAIHVIFFMLWLFFAFRRLFNLHWLSNLLISYLLSRICYIIIYGIYKKLLIAFTLWTM